MSDKKIMAIDAYSKCKKNFRGRLKIAYNILFKRIKIIHGEGKK